MTDFTNQDYLLSKQYDDESNLEARAGLHERFSTGEQGWFDWVFDQFDLPADARVLELGCGPAYLWEANADRIPSGWHLTLTDFSEGMVHEARAALADAEREFSFDVVDAQDIPFEDERFDAVIANHMLYHVPNREQAFSEIRRVLRPGGRLYASTGGKRHMQELYKLVEKFRGSPVERDRSDGFRLENGAAQLAEWFADVTRQRHNNSLRITEAEPVVAYANSGLGADVADPAAFREFLSEQLDDGPIHVTKDTGLFTARRE